ncbi:MAG: Pr6Pr family membrane protein [Oscillospiraceae bacterium]|nr:Pr6Pr family membrane protein [Oscillospiraceae bacterium]
MALQLTPNQKRISCLLKLIAVFSALIGTLLSAYAGRKSFMGGSRVFMYFTIQSNLAAAAVCLVGLFLILRGKPVSGAWFILKFVVTVSITLTGVVFTFVLAPTFWARAWSLPNTLTHLVVPVAAVADFFAVSTAFEIRKKNVFYVTIPPLLYVIYAGIGYARGWEFADGICYPYFFLNWGSNAGAFGFTDHLPYMGCAWWILLLMLFLIGVGYLYLFIADRIRKRFPQS